MSRMRSLPVTHALTTASLCDLLDSGMNDVLLQHSEGTAGRRGVRRGRGEVR